MLLQIERLEIAAAEIDKTEQVLAYMLRPSIEECLNLWFGKSEQTDQEIWNRFGADVALASRGHYDHWALERRAPAPPRGAGDHARPVPAQHVPRHAADVRLRRRAASRWSSAGCASACSEGLRADRAGLPLPGADPLRGARRPASLHGGVGPGDGGARARRPAQRLPRDLPPPPRGDHALRPLPPPQQDPGAGRTPRPRRDFLARQLVPLRPAAGPAAGRHAGLRRHGQEAHGHGARPRVPDPAARQRRGAERRLRVQVCRTGQRLHQDAGAAREAGLSSASATASRTSPPRPASARSTSTSSSATPGACSSRTRPTSRRSAPPSSVPPPGSRTSGASAASRSSASASTAPRSTTAGSPTSTRRSTPQVNFPIIADKDRRVSMLFGMLDATNFRHGSSLGQTMTVRSVFIISPAKRVELILSYPAYVGRNFNEILRVLDALQLSAKYRVATPGQLAARRRHRRPALHLGRRGGAACSPTRAASARSAPTCATCAIRRCAFSEKSPSLAGDPGSVLGIAHPSWRNRSFPAAWTHQAK